MPESLAHLSESAVEQLADGLLADEERSKAEEHLEKCDLCSARLEASRALIEALSALPRFAPSAEFSDLVMANIQLTPRASPVFAWIRHWTPESRRGWTLLVAAILAPMLPLLGVAVWVGSSPVITAPSVIQWIGLQIRALGAASGSTLAQWGWELGLPGLADSAYQMIRGVPLDALIVSLIILAVAIPLSAWSLVRLVRTPTGNVTYAN